MEKPVNCLKCKFCNITWDPRFPYGCGYFGFKGVKLPSVSVKASSGEQCKMFTPKSTEEGKK